MHGKTAEKVQAEFDKEGLEESKFLLPFKVLLATSLRIPY
jgi:glucose-6-phosphate isomerase